MSEAEVDAVAAILIDVALSGRPEPTPADRAKMEAEIAAALDVLIRSK